MRVIIAPQQVLDADPLTCLQADGIILKRRKSLTPEVIARQHRQLRSDPEMVLLVALIHHPQRPGQPADPSFDRSKSELRETLTHTGSAELHDGLDRGG